MTSYKYHLENNIISVEAKNIPTIPTDGIGCFIFGKMQSFKTKIAQYGIENDESETYDSLLSRCICTAIEMRNRGIKQGDIVALCSYNSMDSAVPFIATQFLGAIVASLDPIISIEDSQCLLNQVKPKMLFFSENVTQRVELIMEATKLETITVIFGQSDKHIAFSKFTGPKENEVYFQPIKVDNTKTAVIFFSSGTTGLPKGIEVPHSQILFNGKLYRTMGFDFTVTFNMASLYWISSVFCLVSCINEGATKINCKACTVDDFWKIIGKYKVTFSFLSTAFALQASKVGRPPGNPTSMKAAVVGGSSISIENLKTVRSIFYETNISFGYGQTEVGGITSFKLNDPEEIKLMKRKGNSTGLPFYGLKYKVVDVVTNENLGPNQPGELRLKPTYHMNGYYNQDSSSAWDEDGWLCTGDVVYYDEDFCFYVVDRIKEMMKFQCWIVTPARIEGVLLTHQEVSQAVVIGIPDDDDGDHPMAIIVKRNDSSVTAEDLIRYVEERVDDKHRLRAGVKFVDSLTYTPSGKVKRNDLRQMVLKSMKINTK